MRQIINLNEGWQFTGPEGKTVPVNVPHTWNNIDGQDGGNDYKRCLCTYEKHFPKPAVAEGQRVYLQFHGVNSECEVILNGQTVMTLAAADIAQCVKVSGDLAVTLDSNQLTNWVESNLAPRLDTIGTTRSYTRADGKQVTVEGGNYGWSVDSEALAETLSKNVSAKSASTV
jgi:beta-galactosidase/beta-glucuronidase